MSAQHDALLDAARSRATSLLAPPTGERSDPGGAPRVAAALGSLVAMYLLLPLHSWSLPGQASVTVGLVLVLVAYVQFVAGAAELLERRSMLHVGALLACALGGCALAFEVHRVSVSLLQMVAATIAGLAASWLIERLWWVAALALLITSADAYSVLTADGITSTLLKEQGAAITYLAVLLPAPGTSFGSGIGVSDLVLVAFFVALVRRFALPTGRLTFVLVAPFVLTAIVGGLVDEAVPALPALAMSFVVGYGSYVLGAARFDVARIRRT
jgi:hypothetical protein